MPKKLPDKELRPEHKSRMSELDFGTVKRLLSYMKPYRFRFVLVVVCIIINSVGNVASSLLIKPLIDDYIYPMLGQGANPDYGPLLLLIGKMAIVYLLSAFAAWYYSRCMSIISHSILHDIRCELFDKMQRLPVSYYDSHTHGEMMSYFTNDADTMRQMLSQSIPQVFQSVFTLITVLVSMLSLSVWLTLFTLAFVVLLTKVATFIAGRSGRYFVRQQNALGKVNGYIEEMINGQKVVKVFCREKQAQADFDAVNEQLCEDATQANKFANIVMPVMGSLGYALYVLLAVVGGLFALYKVPNLCVTGWTLLSLGAIGSFIQLSRSFIMPVTQVSQQANSIVMAMAGAGRIFKLMDELPETDEGKVTLVDAVRNEDGSLSESDRRTGVWAWKIPEADGGFRYVELKGRVTLDDVSFGYVEGKTVLHNITLYAEPGQKVAFVGATGAGKTTITNLINRFYDVDEGVIHYDGIDVKDIRKRDLRRSLGIVLQEVYLFTGTVMENIRYGKLDATDEECIAAAKLANAHSFISMLPQGYDTVLSGDGSGLSQGQRQLISIARAAVEDPPVMILDEATSSIDTRTEAIVQSGMDALMYGRTVFVIAHRLSTVHNADAILVLDHGSVIERGSHDDLIDLKGEYYALYTGAFELE